MKSLHTPVALIIFNRPETSERVFAEIAKARPSKLFVIADGARQDRPGEAEKCAAARAVIEQVDWECEVHKNYSDVNIGCAWRPATGISWVFEHVEEAIILEDDCLPDLSFFRFCEELLKKYRDDERVMMVSGNNFVSPPWRTPYSYYFCRNTGTWGWATWRRAWQHHDMKIKLWPELCDTPWLLDVLGDPRAVEYWRNIFNLAHADVDNVNTWDYQWTFACWAWNGLAISSNTNLVSNIGFGGGATHTKWTGHKLNNLARAPMIFPLKHPPYVVQDREADQLLFEQVLAPQRPKEQTSLYRLLRQALSTLIPGPVRKSISFVRSRWS